MFGATGERALRKAASVAAEASTTQRAVAGATKAQAPKRQELGLSAGKCTNLKKWPAKEVYKARFTAQM